MNNLDFDDLAPTPSPSSWRRLPRWWRGAIYGLVSVAAVGVVLLTVLALSGQSYLVRPISPSFYEPSPATARDERAAFKLKKLPPRGTYVVVDTVRNRLSVYAGGKLQREATCSTGTGTVLRDPRNGKSWIFDTPLGERRVLRKKRNPVWAKPEWAFIEEGFLPSTDPRDRFDDVSLGDFALDLGDGYLIHGTLFQSLLGRPVTHGCIRLGDEDLKYVFQTVPLGAAVYLF